MAIKKRATKKRATKKRAVKSAQNSDISEQPAKMLIRIDTREQKDLFLFKSYADVETIHLKVDTGDYCLHEFPDKVTIDRKRSSLELYNNFFFQKDRFDRELERMSKMDFAYFVCSFPFSVIESFPDKSGIPKYKWKLLKFGKEQVINRIKRIEEKYDNIKFIFCRDQAEAEDVTYQILKEYSVGEN